MSTLISATDRTLLAQHHVQIEIDVTDSCGVIVFDHRRFKVSFLNHVGQGDQGQGLTLNEEQMKETAHKVAVMLLKKELLQAPSIQPLNYKIHQPGITSLSNNTLMAHEDPDATKNTRADYDALVAYVMKKQDSLDNTTEQEEIEEEQEEREIAEIAPSSLEIHVKELAPVVSKKKKKKSRVAKKNKRVASHQPLSHPMFAPTLPYALHPHFAQNNFQNILRPFWQTTLSKVAGFIPSIGQWMNSSFLSLFGQPSVSNSLSPAASVPALTLSSHASAAQEEKEEIDEQQEPNGLARIENEHDLFRHLQEQKQGDRLRDNLLQFSSFHSPLNKEKKQKKSKGKLATSPQFSWFSSLSEGLGQQLRGRVPQTPLPFPPTPSFFNSPRYPVSRMKKTSVSSAPPSKVTPSLPASLPPSSLGSSLSEGECRHVVDIAMNPF